MDLKKQVTYLNIKELTPYKRNPRKNDKAVDKLSDAIGKNSFRGAIIVWENSEEIIGEKNIILAGNTRYKALKKMGEKEVPVILERFENEEEAFNFCIMDNKSNEWAEWDFGKLEEELKSLNFLEEDLKDLEEEFSFEKIDFEALNSEDIKDKEINDDKKIICPKCNFEWVKK
jgi:ParB family transcriptional regulator, chromosome partitioning protein